MSTVVDTRFPEVQKVKKADTAERRRRALVRWTSIKAERSRQWKKWADLTDYILPERGRFITGDHNKPKDTSKILNSTPTRMCRGLGAGLMTGCTPRARPWLELTLPDDRLAEYYPVKLWLWEYTRRMRKVLELSGFYRALSQGIYPDMATFGLGACLLEEDPKTIMRFVPLAVGSYGLAQDGEQKIDTLIYEEPWTVAELIKEFGWDHCSASVRSAFNGGYLEQFLIVLRVIEPNAEFLPGSFGAKGMKYGSIWMEIGGLGGAAGALLQPSSDPNIGFLRESAYAEFPAMVGRWSITARDVYPTGPGHDALPESKQLQQLERRVLLGISKGVNPPMLIPESMRLNRLSMLPGDPVYVPSGSTQKIEPAQVVNPVFIDKTENKIRQTEQRISEAYFGDLMRMFTETRPDGGVQPVTAEEVSAKQQEKMLLLGPVLDNMNDFLSSVIERTAAIMERRGLVPPAPREIRGMQITVKFISILFQAQKMIGVQARERSLQFVGQLSQLKGPDATDTIDADKMAEGYFDDIGLPPNCVTPMEVRQQARQARAQKQQAQEQGQAMLAATEGAKNLGNASTGDGGGDNLLTRLIGPMAGAQAGGGQ